MLGDGLKRIYGIAQSLGHFIAILIQHKPIGYYIFERHTIKQHYCYGM